MSKAIEARQIKKREMILDRLRRNPIVQVACQKIGIGRATFYRWKQEDPEFASTAEAAIREGEALINDMAESQLLSAIRDKNMTAIIFWLKHHHQAYTTRVEITSGTKPAEEILSPQQETVLAKALQLAALIPEEKEKKKEPKKKDDKN